MKTKTGGDCMQNPSDLDATYSGHKGPGYQVQTRRDLRAGATRCN